MTQTRIYEVLSLVVTGSLVAALSVGLSACSSAFNPIGSNSYDCNRKQDPASIYCHSFKAVEASTNGELPDSRFDTELKFSQYDRATEIAPMRNPAGSTVKAGAGETMMVGSGSVPQPGGADVRLPDGTPVREGPVIQRTWIKHFVDSNDARIGDTFVYKEIVPTHWAGFDGSDPGNATRGLYPHKTAEAKDPPPASRSQAELPQQTDFIQPGREPAPNPNPGSPTAMSMPQ